VKLAAANRAGEITLSAGENGPVILEFLRGTW
jgi:hypothetical protein